MQIERSLKVLPLWREDVFRDIVRIPKADRGEIQEGAVCTISANGHTRYFIVRGLEGFSASIMLDEFSRASLGGMYEGFCYDFVIREANVFEQIKWACTVADRGARISAWIGVISVALGLLGVVLGLVGVMIALI